MVLIGTSHLWLFRVWTHLSSATVHLSLLVGARSRIVAVFCLHIIRVKALGQMVHSLLRKGAFELAPLSSLGYYSRFVLFQEGLGVVAANIKYLAFVRKIHHLEGSVSAFSDASVFRIVSSVHGIRQSFPVFWLFAWFSLRLRRSSRGSWLRFGVFSTVLDSASALSARLANSGVLPRVDFLSLRTFLWLCNSLGIVSIGRSLSLWRINSRFFLGVLLDSVSFQLLQPGNESTSFSQLAPCFYHEWISLHFLAKVEKYAVLSDSAHSGVTAADPVVPVALHRP